MPAAVRLKTFLTGVLQTIALVSSNMAPAVNRPNIHLYTAQTANGIKASITLEELGLPYEFTRISMKDNDQKQPWYLEINPNGRIPAMTDTYHDGTTIRLFESGSIMQYLVNEYDKDYKISFPPGTKEYYEMNSWLFFQNAGLGPMQGQANHFTHYAPEKIPYGMQRYQGEVRRLYSVLEQHFKDTGNEYIVANKCTIADIAHWGWVAAAGWAGVDIEEFPLLHAWEERMLARPALEKGRHIPVPHTMKTLIADADRTKQREKETREWIQDTVKNDSNFRM